MRKQTAFSASQAVGSRFESGLPLIIFKDEKRVGADRHGWLLRIGAAGTNNGQLKAPFPLFSAQILILISYFSPGSLSLLFNEAFHQTFVGD